MIRIATWNVNSLRVRMEAVLAWLEAMKPDCLCLQELKAEAKQIDFEAFRRAGYRLYARGEKSYNGVAVAMRDGLGDVKLARDSLPGREDDEARYLELSFEAGGVFYRVGSAYFPNGNPVGSDKYRNKMAWMADFSAHARGLLALEEVLVLAGDYNVIPEALDVWDAARFGDDALYQREVREAYRALLHCGFTDALRSASGGERVYSFWDYQGGSYRRDFGLRIDHILLSPRGADLLGGCEVDREVRGGVRPSDHAPVWVDLGSG